MENFSWTRHENRRTTYLQTIEDKKQEINSIKKNQNSVQNVISILQIKLNDCISNIEEITKEMEDNYQCGITQDIYINPCSSCTSCNILYENDALIKHYNTGKNCCPTNCSLVTSINDIRPAAPQFRNALANIKTKLIKYIDTRKSVDKKIIFYESELKPLQNQINTLEKEIEPLEKSVQYLTGSINLLKNPTKTPPLLPITFNSTDIGIDKIIKVQCNTSEQMSMTIKFLVDISGSMNGKIIIKNKEINHNTSYLDLVKQILHTYLKFVENNTNIKVSITVFDDNIYEILPSQFITSENLDSIQYKISDLKAKYQTYTWPALKKTLDTISTDCDPHTEIVLLTDGIPTPGTCDGENLYEGASRYIRRKNISNFCLNTILLGYSGEVKSLVKLAKETNGIYNYMPDAYLVGPIAVHSFMNIINKCCKMVKIILEYDAIPTLEEKSVITSHLNLFHYTFTDNILEIMLGPININSNMSIKLDNTIQYNKIRVEVTDIKCNTYNVSLNEELIIDVEEDNMRLDCINKVYNMCTQLDENPNYDVSKTLDELKNSIIACEISNKEYKKALLTELGESRVGDGLVNPEFHKKWGIYYIPAWYQHHMYKKCPNYLDPALQFYKDEKQKDDISDLFETFNDYEPPEKEVYLPNENVTYRSLSYSVPQTQQIRAVKRDLQANSGQYGDGGGCFHEGCPIWISDNRMVPISTLRKGDSVMDTNGNIVKVECVVRKMCVGNCEILVPLEDDVAMTPWHPVKEIDTDFEFPIYLYRPVNFECSWIYNLIIEGRGNVWVGINKKIMACTLAHNMIGPVIGHPFFGTEEGIIHNLKTEFPNEYENGLVTIFKVNRNPNTGMVEEYKK